MINKVSSLLNDREYYKQTIATTLRYTAMMYMMYSMIIDTPLMTPTTSTIDIMMIWYPIHSTDRSNQTRGIRRGHDREK